MCNKHYLQVRRRERAALAVPCSVGDCDGVVYCSGLCATHYRRWRAYGSTDERRIPVLPYDRVMARVTEQPAPYPEMSPCWIFNGVTNHHGYGMVMTLAGTKRAHRIVAEQHHGPCPDGQQAMHLCDVRTCVNPEHLRWRTPQENTDDMVAKGRARGRNSV